MGWRNRSASTHCGRNVGGRWARCFPSPHHKGTGAGGRKGEGVFSEVKRDGLHRAPGGKPAQSIGEVGGHRENGGIGDPQGLRKSPFAGWDGGAFESRWGEVLLFGGSVRAAHRSKFIGNPLMGPRSPVLGQGCSSESGQCNGRAPVMSPGGGDQPGHVEFFFAGQAGTDAGGAETGNLEPGGWARDTGGPRTARYEAVGGWIRAGQREPGGSYKAQVCVMQPKF